MPKIMEIIAKETKGTSYNTYKYSFDTIGLPSIVYDDDSNKIMKCRIQSKFDEIILDIDKLSAGCKTVLNVMYNSDKVFCLKKCGNNALEVLYSLISGNVYSDYALNPFDMDAVNVQDASGQKEINDYEKLKEAILLKIFS